MPNNLLPCELFSPVERWHPGIGCICWDWHIIGTHSLCLAGKATANLFVLHGYNLCNEWCSDMVFPNEIMLKFTHYHVLTWPKACSVQVYLPPSSSILPFQVASSFIRDILLTAMKKKKKIAPHTSNKSQGGMRKRRSSRLVPATGPRWYHQHTGLVSCFSRFFLLLLICHKKEKKILRSWWENMLLSCHFSTECAFLLLCAHGALLMTQRRMFKRRVGMCPR